MVKDLTREEFAKYVKGLEFHSYADIVVFVRSYLDYYRKLDPAVDKEAHYDAFAKYMIVLQEFGPTILLFSELIMMTSKGKADAAANDAVQRQPV